MANGKHAAAFNAAMEELGDVLGAIGALYNAHPKVIQQHNVLLAKQDEIKEKVKDAAKELAAHDPKFKGTTEGQIKVAVQARTETDIPKLEATIGKPVTEVKGLANTKITVPIDSVKKLVEAGVLPAEALDALKVGSYAVKIVIGEE